MDKQKKEDLINWMKFCNIKGIGSSKTLKLLNIFGSIETLFSASNEDLIRTRIFTEEMIKEFNKLKKSCGEDLKHILEICQKNKIMVIPLISKDYPQSLKFMPDAPLILFALGDISLFQTKKVAIVGSRESSEDTKKWAFKRAQELAKQGITIVSGGAKGIDYSAHKGALSVNGKTICVVGTGFFKLYPEGHKILFEEIKKKGLLLSEYMPYYNGGRISLLRRNRIISGISDNLILTSSSNKGGAMTQLKIAHKQRIPIFCPPLKRGLLPNIGIREAIKKYNANEIKSISQIIKETKKLTIFSFDKNII